VLNAKLFAGLAGLALVISILGRVHALPRTNLSLFVADIAIRTFYTHLFIALVCAVFGFAFFGIVHLMQRPLNQATGLVGFFLVGVASVVWLISSFLVTSDSLRNHWLVVVLFAAIFTFILGVALTAANLAWALLRK
jgi:hypothetical protein